MMRAGGGTPSAIDGSSLTNGSGIVVMGFKYGIPVIGISSGSIDATGNITGITALGRVYPRAWCYFPANAVATVAAAGFRYCTFSTTTAGVAFLDTWAGTGIPTIPSSPTPVTDGKGAYTGVTTAVTGMSLSLPANSMGANGAVEVEAQFAANNSAGTKANNIRFGGTNLVNFSLTTHLGSWCRYRVANSGATNSQTAGGYCAFGGTFYTGGPTAAAFAVDTTAAVTIDCLITRNTATDNVIIEQVSVLILSDGT